MSRILGIGTDLLHIVRIEQILRRGGPSGSCIASSHGTKFAAKVLHDTELAKFVKLQEKQTHSAFSELVRLVSTSWVVKEAVYKALDHEAQTKFSMGKWYKTNDDKGRPLVISPDYARESPQEQFMLTLSHDADLVTATAIRFIDT